jgi:hypothetical protein
MNENYKNTDNIFLCGDFNSFPDSNTVNLVLNKSAPDIEKNDEKFR